MTEDEHNPPGITKNVSAANQLVASLPYAVLTRPKHNRDELANSARLSLAAYVLYIFRH